MIAIFNSIVLVICFIMLVSNQAKWDKNKNENLHLSSITKEIPQFDYYLPYHNKRKIYAYVFLLAIANLALSLF